MASRVLTNTKTARKTSAFPHRRQTFHDFFLDFPQDIFAFSARRKQQFCDMFIEFTGRISAIYPVLVHSFSQFLLFFKGISSHALPQAQVIKLFTISVE